MTTPFESVENIVARALAQQEQWRWVGSKDVLPDSRVVTRDVMEAVADVLERESMKLTASTLTAANRLPNPPSFDWIRAQMEFYR